MAGYTLSQLEADIRSYTETDSNVLTGAILGRFIENAEFRIFYDVPSDNNRFVSEGNLAIDDNTINVPWIRNQRKYWNSICTWGKSFY